MIGRVMKYWATEATGYHCGDDVLVEDFITKKEIAYEVIIFCKISNENLQKSNKEKERCKIYVKERDLYQRIASA